MNTSEARRIEENVSGETPPPVWVRVRGVCRETAVESLERVREVMKLVSSRRARGWSDDERWKEDLPRWFVDSFGHDVEEIVREPALWDFGSWLDAMKGPGWEWWSCVNDDDGWVVNLMAYSDPYSIEPLVYLCRTAGADTVSISEPASSDR